MEPGISNEKDQAYLQLVSDIRGQRRVEHDLERTRFGDSLLGEVQNQPSNIILHLRRRESRSNLNSQPGTLGPRKSKERGDTLVIMSAITRICWRFRIKHLPLPDSCPQSRVYGACARAPRGKAKPGAEISHVQ